MYPGLFWLYHYICLLLILGGLRIYYLAAETIVQMQHFFLMQSCRLLLADIGIVMMSVRCSLLLDLFAEKAIGIRLGWLGVLTLVP